MPEANQDGANPLGDIIGQTRQRLASDDPASLLKSLVAATSPTPPASSAPAASVRNDAARPVLPGNYFPQIPAEMGVTPKRKPLRGPARTLHISMRLSPPERDRLVRWCDDRNLSLPDGIISLLDIVEAASEGEG
ncbi:hypothetical protein [Novosphingobium taihuense]|uniref:hypothetical protein n=1 Tax=Novosphingobium taihuense TaxID=260085 RepID=UPI0011A1BC7F|nr:hypothetical protein [Novosphingobium taihuense]